MNQLIHCWCGNSELLPFTSGYAQCQVCATLVSQNCLPASPQNNFENKKDFYGQQYWFSHQKDDLGLTDITVRARTDLPERCLHWLRTLLKYRVPPANFLELGSAHGGFVALLRWAGFEAMGLELDPWIVEYARQTFQVPMMLGQIEEQEIDGAPFDGIFLLDVLEHFPDPVRTMSRCLNLLKADGIFIVQTPQYIDGKGYEEMMAEKDRFLELLKPDEHLYLFSQRSIREFFRRLGAEQVIFETAIFSHYDMFLVVSRLPILTTTTEEVEKRLSSTPAGRMIQGMIDLKCQTEQLQIQFGQLQSQVAQWERQVGQLQSQVAQWERQVGQLQGRVAELQNLLEACEEDRFARLKANQNFEQSLSWRVTAPFRSVKAKWNRYFRKR